MTKKKKSENFFYITDLGYGKNYLALIIVGLLLLTVLCFRLWQLQIISGSDYRLQSESNRIRKYDIQPYRGLIFDRHGEILVDNGASFSLMVLKEDILNEVDTIKEVALLTKRPLIELEEKFYELSNEALQGQRLQIWLSNLSMAEVMAIETRSYNLPGLYIEVSLERKQTNGLLAPHILGYVGLISEEQLKQQEFGSYKKGEITGKAGIESSMEHELRGKNGVLKVEVNTHERVLNELEKEEPVAGNNIQLTLDARLQALAQELLAEQAGAIVLLDPRNFEVLTLASSPAYDLTDFSGGVGYEVWENLLNDKFRPLQDRAVGGQYPPGSTFKIFTVLAALEEGIITPQTKFHCAGSYQLGNRSFGCWNRRGHGAVNLHRALKESCDVYFYQVILKLGIEKLSSKAHYFGIGQKNGLELSTEKAGLMPNPNWKQNTYKQPWYRGDSLSASIGQGSVLATPLQVALMTAVTANGGILYRPHLVKAIYEADGTLVKNTEKEILSKFEIKPEYLEAVQKGLVAVVNEPGGTGRRARLAEHVVAGKSGTSQVVSMRVYQAYSKANVPYQFRDHAWFTAYAPAENPEIVVTVLLEHTGGGGANAAPLVAEMLKAYFNSDIVAKRLPPSQIQPNKPTGWAQREGLF